MDKRTILTTQIIMTLLMATSMSGIMSLIAIGPSRAWLAAWPGQVVIAWPIAFVMTMMLWPAANRIARVFLPRNHGSGN